jgi:hypothetical protein
VNVGQHPLGGVAKNNLEAFEAFPTAVTSIEDVHELDITLRAEVHCPPGIRGTYIFNIYIYIYLKKCTNSIARSDLRSQRSTVHKRSEVLIIYIYIHLSL